MSRMYVEWFNSESGNNVRNNAPISPGLPHDPTVCKIDGIKITDSVGKIIIKKLVTRN